MLQGLFSVTAAFRYFISKCVGGGISLHHLREILRCSTLLARPPDLQRLQPSISTRSEIAAATERGLIFISAKTTSDSFLAVRSSLWKLETTVKTAFLKTPEKKRKKKKGRKKNAEKSR